MILTQISRIDYVLFFLLSLGPVLSTHAQQAVPFTPRLDGGSLEMRGDIVFVANNILNKATAADPSQANIPYNGTELNDYLWMEYIDIDGDPTTFSSSSAELNFADPTCSRIRYAGLYWAASYPIERSTQPFLPYTGTPRIEDWFTIKFKVPGQPYVDLSADTAPDAVGQEDDIIFDGYDPKNPNYASTISPYICYKNVTDIVSQNSDPNGSYTVANMRATKGQRRGGSSAGWVLVVIYENPNESGKFISIFDGYASMATAFPFVDVPVNGFRTLPAPFPVRARVGIAALEGDRGITNDRFYLRANSNANFTNISTGLNAANNFFNSTITTNGAEVTTRIPFGTNTLGTDMDVFNINNPPGNTVIPNDETGATLRFTSTGDSYATFLAAFSVEIIEPDILLKKRVEDIAGDDITGLGVSLGQTLDYVLSFRNLGNDDATNYTIRDVLPVNTSYVSFDNSGAPGVTSTHNTLTNEVTFTIPDALVKKGNPSYSIRLRVKVAENCFDFIDACSDQIRNSAFSTYQGVINGAVLTDDPSVAAFDSCGFVTPGASNFLIDNIADCDFTRSVLLCGDDVVLDVGDNFDSYVWVRDANENKVIDPSDPVLNDGDPDGDPSTLLVNEEGTYIAQKIGADPCKDFFEILTVERFGFSTINPIIYYLNTINNDADISNNIASEIVNCSSDGDQLAELYLCGSNDSQLLQTAVTGAQNISWELLDESSCAAAPDDCANKNISCTWNQIATGTDFTVSTAGKYRIIVSYQNGCFNRFYFDVFRNDLTIAYDVNDIVCTTPGNINITNLGSIYGYQLIDITNNSILVPFSADNGPNFPINTNGQYRVDIAQLDMAGNPIAGSCVFSTPDIGILNRAMDVDIRTTPANCNTQGSIEIDINNVFPNYTYVLRLADGTLIDDEIAQPSNTHIFNISAGDYIIETSTANGCFDSQAVTVDKMSEPTLSALTTRDIGCNFGTIALTRTGGLGNPDFLYAIWSKDNDGRYTNINDIPPEAYQVSPIFTFGWRDTDGDGTRDYIPGEEGEYVFVVADANACTAFSNPTTINDNGPMTITPTHTAVVCRGSNTASLNISISGGVAPFSFSLDNGATTQTTDTFVNVGAGSYDLLVRDSSGCEIVQTYTIADPFILSAFAGVTQVVECNLTDEAEVLITNAQGGTAPYQYSFDGGANFGPSNSALLHSGTHTVIIRDAVDCELPMTVLVPDPIEPPTFTSVVTYECDGEGDISISTSNTSDFDYTYALNGVPNSPVGSAVFTNVTPGNHTVSVNYISNTVLSPIELLSENFGVGPTTSITQVDPNYCYEPLDGTTRPCNLGGAGSLVNGEYTVTSQITGSWSGWTSPNDRSNTPNGRFLAIDLGTVAGLNGIIYAKRNIDIIANKELTVSLAAFNLIRLGQSGSDVSIVIELVDNLGVVVDSFITGDIPKNTSPDDWYDFSFGLDPGSNSTIDIVIRSEKNTNIGNDLAVDAISAFQAPEVCASTFDVPLLIEGGRAFGANAINSTRVSCNGLSDGTITFEVENFDAIAGFDYSVDGGLTYSNTNSSPVTTAAVFPAGNQTILLQKADDTSCTASISQTVTEPLPFVSNATITRALTCTNAGATITASGLGGTATYQYQLEDTSGGIITAYQTSVDFTNVAAGDYVVRARDSNLCSDTTPINVLVPADPAFTATPTACYSGASNGEIQIDIDPASIPGNGGFQFSIAGGAWMTPTPATASTYSFTGLTNGSYTIDVKDAFGCAAPQQTITINPPITANAVLNQDLTCLLDASITVNATGGSGTFSYEWANTATGPWNSTGFVVNAFSTATDGTYYFRVTDNTAPAPCNLVSNPVVVTPAPEPVITTVTATNLICNSDASGELNIVFDTGIGLSPYTIEVFNTTTSVSYGTQTAGLTAGNYTVTLTDAKGCFTNKTAVITEPDPITYTVTTVPIQCSGTATIDGSITISNIAGGTAEYTYMLTANNGNLPMTHTTASGARDHTFDILTFGVYQVDILDANGCASFSTEIIASPPDDLIIDMSTPTTDCSIGGTAIVTVAAAVGSGNYEFSVLEFFSTPFSLNYIGPDPTPIGNTDTATFEGLTPGIPHTFVVHDLDTNCYYFETAEPPIDSPSNLTTAIDPVANVTCTGAANGNISFTIDNYDAGATSVTYDIYLAQSNISTGITGSITSLPPVGNGVTENNVGALPPGGYFLLLTEVGGAFDGCSIFGGDFIIYESVNLLDINLAVIKNDNCTMNEGVIRATGQFGTAPYEYQFLTSGSAAPTVATWAGGTNSLHNGEGGTYDVYIKDANNCIQMDTIVLPTDPVPGISVAIVDECVPESAFEVVITLDTPGMAPYSLSVNGGAFQNISFDGSNQYTLTNVHSGSLQSVTIRDLNGCAETDNFTIHPPLQFNATLTAVIDCEVAPNDNGEITIDVTAGSNNYEYHITGPVPVAQTALPPSPFVWNLANTPGTYTITVHDMFSNCSSSKAVVVPPAVYPVLNINAFTDVSCYSADDGTITVSVPDNGIGPYTFEIVAASAGAMTLPIASIAPPGTSGAFVGLEGSSLGISYTIRATAANFCFVEETQTITQPERIANVNATVVEFGCTAGNNSNFATITIDDSAITGGSGAYLRYQFINDTAATTVQDGVGTSFTETNLAGGAYTINVYDENGCIGSTTAVLNPFVAISDPLITTNIPVTCTPGNDAEIRVSVSMTPPSPVPAPILSYTVTGTNIVYAQTNTTGTFNGLGVGDYTVAITNPDTGCVIETTHTVDHPNIIEVLATKSTDEECLNNGVNDGSFSVAIGNYTGTYSYRVFDSTNTPVLGFSGTGNTLTPLLISNLPGGGYYVRITETAAPFCEADSNAIPINTPSAPISITANEEASPTCANDQGAILVDPEGGIGPYTIVLDNITTSQTYTENGVNASNFTGLSAGIFSITATDALGCAETETITLIRPDNYIPTISRTPLSCHNTNTATVFSSEPTGRNVSPTAQYEYRLNSYTNLAGTTLLETSVAQASPTFTGLGAGFYSITTTDNFGCSFTSIIEEVVNPSQVAAALLRTSPLTCLTEIEFELTASGGLSGSYEYSSDAISWLAMPGNTVTILEPLAGTYRYFVRDAVNTCKAVSSNEITESPIEDLLLIIDASAAFINCSGQASATIYASATGGMGEYQYQLFTDPALTTNYYSPGHSQPTGVFNTLPAGIYYVNVLSGDCYENPKVVNIIEPTALTYTDTDPVLDALCFGDENGSITVTLSGGAEGYKYAISPNLNRFDDKNTFDGLAAGLYTVIAQDQNDCFLELEYTIYAPLALRATGVATPETCAGKENGIIALDIQDGKAPYSTRLNGESNFIQDRDYFTDMAAGAYMIFVRDANDCEIELDMVITAGENLNASVEPVYECTGDTPANYINITLEDPSVRGDVMFALDSTDPAAMQFNPNFRNADPGTHFITIAHANGCVLPQVEFEIEDYKPLTLTLAQSNLNEITATAEGGRPNYTFYFDGIANGTENVYRINKTGTYVVRVVDEIGCEAIASIEMEFIDIEIPIFFTPDGDDINDVWLPGNQEDFPEILTLIFDRYGREVYRLRLNDDGWNGLYKQKTMPSGDYWYVIKLRGSKDAREFVGNFTLYR